MGGPGVLARRLKNWPDGCPVSTPMTKRISCSTVTCSSQPPFPQHGGRGGGGGGSAGKQVRLANSRQGFCTELFFVQLFQGLDVLVGGQTPPQAKTRCNVSFAMHKLPHNGVPVPGGLASIQALPWAPENVLWRAWSPLFQPPLEGVPRAGSLFSRFFMHVSNHWFLISASKTALPLVGAIS